MARNPNIQSDLDRWFVQTKGQIIGPIPGQKVLERLVSDEITVIHRVSRDRRTWAAICNTPYFEDLIQYRIRAYTGESQSVGQMRAGGDDEPEFEISQVFGLHGATDNISEQLDHARQLEELTANIQKLNFLRKEIALKKQTITKEKESDEDAQMHPDDENVFIAAASKKSKFADLFQGSEVSKKRMYVLLAVVVVGAIGTQSAIMYNDNKKNDEDRAKLQEALSAQASGDYAKAISSVKGIKSSSLANREFASAKELISLADAHIKGRDPKTGQALLSRALAMNPSPSDKARAHILQAVMASDSGNLVQASIELEESLKSEELYSTLHNLGVLKLKLKKPLEAEPLLLKALAVAGEGENIDTTPTVLAAFEAALALDRADAAAAAAKPKADPIPIVMRRLESVSQLLDAAAKKTTPWHDELALATSVTHFFLGQTQAFQLAAIELMDSSSEVSNNKGRKGLDYDLAKWNQLYKYCTEVYNQPKSTDFVAAFYAACLKRSHGAAQALPFAKYALALRPTDAVYIGLTADLLLDLKKDEEAEALLFNNGLPITGSKLAAASVERLKVKGIEIREPASNLIPPAVPTESASESAAEKSPVEPATSAAH
jgi:tetratricopeptide (TPR) repeat protein